MATIDALKGYPISYVKFRLSKLTGYSIGKIRLHGSRINGIPKPDSDLDVAILDETLDEGFGKFHYIYCCGMVCEIGYIPSDYYTDDWKISWLRYSA